MDNIVVRPIRQHVVQVAGVVRNMVVDNAHLLERGDNETYIFAVAYTDGNVRRVGTFQVASKTLADDLLSLSRGDGSPVHVDLDAPDLHGFIQALPAKDYTPPAPPSLPTITLQVSPETLDTSPAPQVQ